MGPLTARTTIGTAELKRLLDRGEAFRLLDVRNEDEFARWQIEGRQRVPTVNVPYFQFVEAPEAGIAQTPADLPVVAVCAKGGSSAWVADEILRPRGYAVSNLDGGMEAWGRFYDAHPVPDVRAPLRLWQLERPSRGCLHYVCAYGPDGKSAVVIDPPRHLGPILDLAREEGLTITHVFDTHAHADHISGGPALAKATGAGYYLHPYDGIHPIDMRPMAVPYLMLHDEQTFALSPAVLRVIHIPGHTLGNTALLLEHAGQHFLFSGDSIFIRSIARPDLGGRGEAWAPLHYRSIFRKLLVLPDDTLVLPGHYSSPQEVRPDGLFAATIGALKQSNADLAPQTEAEFVGRMLKSLPVFPPQYADIKRVNAGLLEADEEKANELELGKNACALAGAYSRPE
jgi:glyoxylase-like metal-dependent hydrolase (beta-lactamase superfamily II)/rhodanese-related sulfurtransferase